jgi:hypothetical protein
VDGAFAYRWRDVRFFGPFEFVFRRSYLFLWRKLSLFTLDTASTESIRPYLQAQSLDRSGHKRRPTILPTTENITSAFQTVGALRRGSVRGMLGAETSFRRVVDFPGITKEHESEWGTDRSSLPFLFPGGGVDATSFLRGSIHNQCHDSLIHWK